MDMSCRHWVMLRFVFAGFFTTAANRAYALTKSAGAGLEHAQLRTLAMYHKGHNHQFSALQYNSQLHASGGRAPRSLAGLDTLRGSVRTAAATAVVAEPQEPVQVVNTSYPFRWVSALHTSHLCMHQWLSLSAFSWAHVSASAGSRATHTAAVQRHMLQCTVSLGNCPTDALPSWWGSATC